jgi:predicted small lipoprotein YifL
MRSDAHHGRLGRRIRRCRCSAPQPLRLLSLILIGMVVLCGSAGCGRKGPLKPLKKEAPSYHFSQAERAH